MVVIIGSAALGAYWDIRWQTYVVNILDRKMKIRLAKKIMKCEMPDPMIESFDEIKFAKAKKVSPYWTKVWLDCCSIDHRITKAVSLTSKSRNECKKSGRRSTFGYHK